MSSTQRIQQRGATSRIPRRSAILGTTCLFALAPFALALMFAGNTHAQKPVHVWQPSGNSGFVQTLPDEWTAEGHVGSVEFGEPETNPFAPSVHHGISFSEFGRCGSGTEHYNSQCGRRLGHPAHELAPPVESGSLRPISVSQTGFYWPVSATTVGGCISIAQLLLEKLRTSSHMAQ